MLELTTNDVLNTSLLKEEREALNRFNRLNPDHKIKAQSYMIELYEKQKSKKEQGESNDSSVAADKPLRKTGTTNSGK